VLVWTALGAIAAAVVLAVRWLLRGRDSLGRPRAFPVVSVVGLALVGAAMLVPAVRYARLEHRLGSVATTLVGVDVTVDCQGAGQEFVDAGAELGYVRYGPDGVPERETLIKRQQCKALQSYLSSDREQPSRDQVVAVHILSHEARHMAGTTDESVAECEAVQRDALTARLLGATVEQAHALARTYWREVYPRMRDDYRTDECAPGGRLDERLELAPWSTT
jgi:hypothetical protein